MLVTKTRNRYPDRNDTYPNVQENVQAEEPNSSTQSTPALSPEEILSGKEERWK
jgi:hypothetical protein